MKMTEQEFFDAFAFVPVGAGEWSAEQVCDAFCALDSAEGNPWHFSGDRRTIAQFANLQDWTAVGRMSQESTLVLLDWIASR